MNSFESMVGQLHTFHRRRTTKQIPRSEYEVFCNEYVFEKLKGLSFGQAFCKRLGIYDYALQNVSSEMAKELIEKLDYIKE